jgi:hypothetical protein
VDEDENLNPDLLSEERGSRFLKYNPVYGRETL